MMDLSDEQPTFNFTFSVLKKTPLSPTDVRRQNKKKRRKEMTETEKYIKIY